MKPKQLAILNLLALVALYVTPIPYNKEIGAVLILIVSILLLLK